MMCGVRVYTIIDALCCELIVSEFFADSERGELFVVSVYSLFGSSLTSKGCQCCHVQVCLVQKKPPCCVITVQTIRYSAY